VILEMYPGKSLEVFTDLSPGIVMDVMGSEDKVIASLFGNIVGAIENILKR
jgi:hypothetical protein